MLSILIQGNEMSDISMPNILFILSDQQRWDTLGCYGQKLNVTPELDKLASRGVCFEYAFTPQPLCGPARASIQTGKYPTQTGNYRNAIALPETEKTMAHYLSKAGYQVAYIGKWHLASTIGKNLQGKDYRTRAVPLSRRGGYNDFWLASDVLEFTSHGYDGYLYDSDMKKVSFKGYRADCLTDYTINYIQNRKSSKPFYLFLSFVEPHHQNDRHCFQAPVGLRKMFENFDVPGDLSAFEGDWPLFYPDYLACCRSVDSNVGRIYKALLDNDLAENTIVIYTSDHGCHFKTRNDEYKRSCHESSVRIPLIMLGQNFNNGRKIERLVSLIDLAPTVLNMANIPQPTYMPGKPLQRLLNKESDWKDEIFIQISESKLARTLRTERWKYTVCAPEKDPLENSYSTVYREDCLYDLLTDPHEKVNVIHEHKCKDICDEMRGKIIEYIFQIEGITVTVISNEKASL